MQNKTIILLGACGGIAKEILNIIKKNGYKVLVVDVSDSINDLASNNVITIQGDLGNYETLDRIEEALKQLPPLYGIVSAVGIMIPGSVTEISSQDWDKTLSINVTYIMRFLKRMIPTLIKNKKSRVILIASVLGVVGSYNLTAYSVSKAALIELVKCLALDYGDKGMLTNCISPGFVKTQMLEDAMSTLSKNKNWMFSVGGLPKKYVNPLDIAETVLFLLNQSSINGENIIIDAAYSSR